MKGKVGDEGVSETHTCAARSYTEKKPLCCAGNPSGLQQDWTPGQHVKGKRGRKPKLLTSKERSQRKDRHLSEKQAAVEERSGSESSEHGEMDGPSCLSS